MMGVRTVSEIIELEEEEQDDERDHKRSNHSLRDRRRSSKLEDDLNKLFEAINLKKHTKSIGTHSPRASSPDAVSLKQALRGFCLSQASEMASSKRYDSARSSPLARTVLETAKKTTVQRPQLLSVKSTISSPLKTTASMPSSSSATTTSSATSSSSASTSSSSPPVCERCQCEVGTGAAVAISRSSCSNRPHMSKDERWKAIRRAKAKHGGSLGLENFNLLKKLGCGDIGTVYQAELVGADVPFAIKVMDNEYLGRRKKLGRSQTEKEILRLLDHPFLPTLYSHFSSDNLSCLVMEYCPGGDLHVLRQKQPSRNFAEPAARFYAAEVLLALEYLHMLGVVYRDLKPENILVREDGHVMLTDFDLSLRCQVSPVLMSSASPLDRAKVVASGCVSGCAAPSCFSPRLRRKPPPAVPPSARLQLVAEPSSIRSNSYVGTHEYLAPEIIKGDGHGSAVDWWTFGIFLYELLYGRTPFKGSSGNDETLSNVVLRSLAFPDAPAVSPEAVDLITGLLVKDPDWRLGSERGAADIKQHPFFDGLNWALIRCTVPPEVPDLCGLVDGSGLESRADGFLRVGSTGQHLEFELF